MRKSLSSEPQIVHMLGQAEVGEKSIGQLCPDHGISMKTFDRRRRRYGGMGIPELRQKEKKRKSVLGRRTFAVPEVWTPRR
jgi:putative transposase